ncbi:MAG: hypothetical protein AB8B56_05425 [Crocinitomicaceae bacterium]
MNFRKLILLLPILLFSHSIYAIEAFKSMGNDLDTGFTYILFVLGGKVLPIMVGAVFITLRHVNKNPWYSFGIYIPALWFIAAHYIIKTYKGANETSFSFGLIIVIIVMVIHIFLDYDRVQKNRITQQ